MDRHERSLVPKGESSVKLTALQNHALNCVRRSPGLTQREYDKEFHSSDPRGIGRRLSELEGLGLIKRGDRKRCTVSGKNAVAWFPAEVEVVKKKEGFGFAK